MPSKATQTNFKTRSYHMFITPCGVIRMHSTLTPSLTFMRIILTSYGGATDHSLYTKHTRQRNTKNRLRPNDCAFGLYSRLLSTLSPPKHNRVSFIRHNITEPSIQTAPPTKSLPTLKRTKSMEYQSSEYLKVSFYITVLNKTKKTSSLVEPR